MDPERADAELRTLLADAPSPFPLDRAALLLAVDAYPDLVPEVYEERLDRFASRVGAAAGDHEPRRRVAALRRVLFEEEGFHGNREAYYDVRNSYLNEVLDRKLGIPISLAAVVLGVTRRLGWPVEGVSFPGHFLLRYQAREEALAIDPFHGGLILDPEELAERWRFATGSDTPPAERMLRPAGPREILVRMLNNIRMIHTRDRAFRAAAAATAKISLVEPEQPAHQRDLAYYLLAAGDATGAIEHLEAYLARVPHGPDASTVRTQLAAIREDGERG